MSKHKTRQFLLLDRDGVINYDSDDYIKSPEEWVPIPGSLEVIAEFSKRGVEVIVVTNQSGIARGFYDKDTLDSMHAKMSSLLKAYGGKISSVYFCPHHPNDNCLCRKPLPGMLDKIEDDYGISLAGVPLVGDTHKDIKLAMNKSCLPILVRSGKGSQTEEKHPNLLSNTSIFDNLFEAGHYLLNNHYCKN